MDNLQRFPLGFFWSSCTFCFKWFSYRAFHTIRATVWLLHVLLRLRVACLTAGANLSLAFPHKSCLCVYSNNGRPLKASDQAVCENNDISRSVSISLKWQFAHVSRSSSGLPPDCPLGLDPLAWALPCFWVILHRQQWPLYISMHYCRTHASNKSDLKCLDGEV